MRSGVAARENVCKFSKNPYDNVRLMPSINVHAVIYTIHIPPLEADDWTEVTLTMLSG